MDGIRVVVRVRPQIGDELSSSDPAHERVVECDAATGSVTVAAHRSKFDVVLGPESTQDDVYASVAGAVSEVMNGINACVLAYGQTGSGKTHTMLGEGVKLPARGAAAADGEDDADDDAAMLPEDSWGVIPRAVAHLFALVDTAEAEAAEAFEATSPARDAPGQAAEAGAQGAAAAGAGRDEPPSSSITTVACSYMQLYNESVLDLLQHGREARPLTIHERKRGRRAEVFVRGLSEVRVTSAADVMRLLEVGRRNRKVRATEFNEASSRSHAVLQLAVEVETPNRRGTTVIRRAKLTLVDLAGSEKWAASAKRGSTRVREMTSINRSLSALGNVVAALTTPGRTHVPYRDSKLTRLLQDSVGGNCRTAVVATLNPTAACADESTSTLLFADRARRVMTKVKANEILDDAQRLAQALKEVARLKAKLRDVRSKRMLALQAENERLVHENERLRSFLQAVPQGRAMVRRAVAEGVMAGGRRSGGGSTPRRSGASQAGAVPPHSAEGSTRLRDGRGEGSSGLASSDFGRRERGQRKRTQPRSRPASPMGSPAKPAPGGLANPRSPDEKDLPQPAGLSLPSASGLGRSPSPLRAAERHRASRAHSPVSGPAAAASPDAATILRNVAIAEAAADEAERAAASLSVTAPDPSAAPQAPGPAGPPASEPGPQVSPASSQAYSDDSFGDYGDEDDAFEDDASGEAQAGAVADGGSADRGKIGAAGGRGKKGAAAAGTDAPKFRFDARDVGCRVRLRSARLGAEEEGTVTAFDAARGMHLVLYDSGDRKWHTLGDRDFAVFTGRAPQGDQDWPGSGEDDNALGMLGV
ncbi:hypothetical protein FNF29_00885 [Cafeteria roenbergensis]|uniref:Kinesin-like protein n=1 Tax=Cafeteria roenbergensis TaxID=33653 RepID=A0A5A8CWB5_CAFRO|nr:hypothetical protein FNF29_00885 [Cafeteria roenbergensis]|eukprot:KAA0156774.1 hypothetical protein FNF29_00885 [Cafeteria roenbergensis]